MKRGIRLTALLALILGVFCLCACGEYMSVEKALTDNGYELVESVPESAKIESESKVAVTSHSFYNLEKKTYVLCYEFINHEKMKEFITDGDIAKSMVKGIDLTKSESEVYESLVQKGYANGNCLVLPFGSDHDAVLKLVREA